MTSLAKSMARLHETFIFAVPLQTDICQYGSDAVKESLARVYRIGSWRSKREAPSKIDQLTEDYLAGVLQIIERHGLWLSDELGRALPEAAGGFRLAYDIPTLLAGK